MSVFSCLAIGSIVATAVYVILKYSFSMLDLVDPLVELRFHLWMNFNILGVWRIVRYKVHDAAFGAHFSFHLYRILGKQQCCVIIVEEIRMKQEQRWILSFLEFPSLTCGPLFI